MLNLPISDIMNDHPIKVSSDVSVRNVAHLMMRYRINGILVMDVAQPERLLGVITTRDFLSIMGEALAKKGQKMKALKDLGSRSVGEFLPAEGVVSLQITDNAAKAVVLMHKKSAVTIPVYDGDKLVGVIGRHDILNIAFA